MDLAVEVTPTRRPMGNSKSKAEIGPGTVRTTSSRISRIRNHLMFAFLMVSSHSGIYQPKLHQRRLSILVKKRKRRLLQRAVQIRRVRKYANSPSSSAA